MLKSVYSLVCYCEMISRRISNLAVVESLKVIIISRVGEVGFVFVLIFPSGDSLLKFLSLNT